MFDASNKDTIIRLFNRVFKDKMTHVILSDLIASVSELKKHPMRLIKDAQGAPIAILNRNQPVFYCICPDMFERMLEKLEDDDLVQIITKRSNEKEIKVDINDL